MTDKLDTEALTARLDFAVKWFEPCTLSSHEASKLRNHLANQEARIEQLKESCRRLGRESFEARRELDRERLPA